MREGVAGGVGVPGGEAIGVGRLLQEVSLITSMIKK